VAKKPEAEETCSKKEIKWSLILNHQDTRTE
jgi:hypothetical protein